MYYYECIKDDVVERCRFRDDARASVIARRLSRRNKPNEPINPTRGDILINPRRNASA